MVYIFVIVYISVYGMYMYRIGMVFLWYTYGIPYLYVVYWYSRLYSYEYRKCGNAIVVCNVLAWYEIIIVYN